MFGIPTDYAWRLSGRTRPHHAATIQRPSRAAPPIKGKLAHVATPHAPPSSALAESPAISPPATPTQAVATAEWQVATPSPHAVPQGVAPLKTPTGQQAEPVAMATKTFGKATNWVTNVGTTNVASSMATATHISLHATVTPSPPSSRSTGTVQRAANTRSATPSKFRTDANQYSNGDGQGVGNSMRVAVTPSPPSSRSSGIVQRAADTRSVPPSKSKTDADQQSHEDEHGVDISHRRTLWRADFNGMRLRSTFTTRRAHFITRKLD